MENKTVEESIDKYAETRRVWRLANKDKLAMYARNYYHKRCEKDADYKVKLCERKKTNNKMNGQNKSVGRPRLYSPEIPI